VNAFAFKVPPCLASAQQFDRTDLKVDSSTVSASAANVDPNLVNAWGTARGSGSPWWISDNGTGLSTLYDATGKAQSLVVKIPTPDGTGTSAPTEQCLTQPLHSWLVLRQKRYFCL
jgi:hypothetical protein